MVGFKRLVTMYAAWEQTAPPLDVGAASLVQTHDRTAGSCRPSPLGRVGDTTCVFLWCAGEVSPLEAQATYLCSLTEGSDLSHQLYQHKLKTQTD